MESHPYTKPRGVGPVTTQLTPGAEPASSKSAGAPGPWSCSPTCRAWSESSMPSFTDSTSTGAGCTCTPCNNSRATPPAFLHQQLDVTLFCQPLCFYTVTSAPGVLANRLLKVDYRLLRAAARPKYLGLAFALSGFLARSRCMELGIDTRKTPVRHCAFRRKSLRGGFTHGYCNASR